MKTLTAMLRETVTQQPNELCRIELAIIEWLELNHKQGNCDLEKMKGNL